MDFEDRESGTVTALDFDIIRTAYRALVGGTEPEESVARSHAMAVVHQLTGLDEVDDELITRIIR